ncbi:glycoside hydrolase family 99-like domain-containing protein [Scandinavium goeteborgense]|uniref:glycosyltransferase WbsX family protein n=1 Tax=Scandinavium goeteborgense TaxID=1851514 RepID=UPI0021667CC6|nr:glycoside hydrolase family 99-like domain-containing protein [Scandinavium goeteborgense]MCS2154923.1 glycoside hydrolase family 99-like domain-containing protein [Scandinavium goeteborgense]
MKKNIIAYYLPQFHEIKENNEWWGKGFTEWTALKNAQIFFPTQNIRYPDETLGYYDLTDKDIIEKQYQLANKNGIDAFCIWTYWFGNDEKILEKPLSIILENELNVRYCIAWANHTWFNKSKGILLKEQKYLGKSDYIKFFNYLRPHFISKNYIKKNNKPIVTIFDPSSIPDLDIFVATWDELAKECGFAGVYFIGDFTNSSSGHLSQLDGFLDSRVMYNNRTLLQKVREKLVRKYRLRMLGPIKYDYKKMVIPLWKNEKSNCKEIPIIFSGWDTTIRHGKQGVFYNNFDECTFEINVRNAIKYNSNQDLVFLKSWNEWAEGNTVEPDTVFSDKLLKIIEKHNK